MSLNDNPEYPSSSQSPYRAEYGNYLQIPMQYQLGVNNHQTGKARREMTIKLVARFGLTSPSLIAWLYCIPKRQALEHLNALVEQKALCLVKTHRSPDDRVYVLDYIGAKYAEELLSVAVYFRSGGEPSLRVNQNTIMHDLMMQYVLLRGIHNWTKSGEYHPYWQRFLTEPEFKRTFTSNQIRNVDGIVQEPDGRFAAIEMEHSLKTKASREAILGKWLSGLKQGYYQKMMLFSHSSQIFDDIKRLHTQLFEELPNRKGRKGQSITAHDIELLESAIVYRSALCNELMAMFYP
ncbi:hypothetical protein L2750_06075 [Shewanella submarina]|uniref:Uncharacterized protein n=1 Tax=Shewanella submarina TaxID=2016376 RepID=A0ABV7G8T7_9GAMM|nr:hypothetical protein [Shewanella submarina]MCL1036717.1 hypothetical protein [Shewanella submarina]